MSFPDRKAQLEVWGLDGDVKDVYVDGSTYITGEFESMSQYNRNAILLTRHGDVDFGLRYFPSVNGTVKSVLVNTEYIPTFSDFLIAGDFTEASIYKQKFNVGGLIHVIPYIDGDDGGKVKYTVDMDHSYSVNGSIREIKKFGGYIYFVGDFSSFGGHAVSNIARVNDDTLDIDTSFSIEVSGGIYDITYDNENDEVYVGGDFSFVEGENFGNLFRFNNTTGLVSLTWSPDYSNGIVYAVEYNIDLDSLYVGGSFTDAPSEGEGEPVMDYINKISRNCPSCVTGWTAGYYSEIINNTVYDILYTYGKLYVVGDFAYYGGSYISTCLSELNPYTGVYIDGIGEEISNTCLGRKIYKNPYNNYLYLIAQMSNVTFENEVNLFQQAEYYQQFVILGTNFNTVPNQTNLDYCDNYSCRFPLHYVDDNPYTQDLFAIGFSHHGEIFFGGNIDKVWYKSGEVQNIVPTISDLDWWQSFNGNFVESWGDDQLADPGLQTGELIDHFHYHSDLDGSGGTAIAKNSENSLIIGTNSGAIFKKDAGSGQSQPYTCNFGAPVYDIEMFNNGGDMIVGGESGYHGYIFKYYAPTCEDAGDFYITTNGPVYKLMRYGDYMYVGGAFTTVTYDETTDYNFSGLFRFSVNPEENYLEVDATWNPNVIGSVRDMTITDYGLFIGGDIESVGGNSVSNLARIDLATGAYDNTFTIGTNGTVYAMDSTSKDVFVGGDFSNVGGRTMNSLSKIRLAENRVDHRFNPQLNGPVYAMGISQEKLVVGGGFNEVDGYPNANHMFMFDLDYQVTDLYGAFNVYDVENGLSILDGSNYGSIEERVVRYHYGPFPIAEGSFAFSTDLKWDNVSGNVDPNRAKSVIVNLGTAPGAVGTHSLFVKKDDRHNAVWVCPHATTLSEVYLDCPDGYSLSETSPEVSIETHGGDIFWKIGGLSGTGALGYSIDTVDLVLTPDFITETASPNEVMMSYTLTNNIVVGDKIRFTWLNPATPASHDLVLTNTCTVNSNSHGVPADVNINTDIYGNIIYEYVSSVNINIGTMVEFCVVVDPVSASRIVHSVRVTDDNGAFGNALFYLLRANQVFVHGVVAPTLSFNIVDFTDTNETNVCNIGTVATNSHIPDEDDQLEEGECGYGLAVGTNAVEGYQISVRALTPLTLQGGIYEVADVANDVVFGNDEAYGFTSVIPASTGVRNTGTGAFDRSASAMGSYTISPTPIPVLGAGIYSALFTTDTSNIYTSEDGIATDVNRVVHGLRISSGTPAGMYQQILEYVVTARF